MRENELYIIIKLDLASSAVMYCYMCTNFNNRNRWLHSILQGVDFRRLLRTPQLMSVNMPTANHRKCLELPAKFLLAGVPNSCPLIKSVSVCDI